MSDAWYKDGLRFECTRCGGCCRGEPGYVWVSDAEIVAIARHLEMPTGQFMERYVRQVFGDYSLIELEGGDCIFWSPEGCRIYAVRPTQCRTFPFWGEYLVSAKHWVRAGLRCPGVNRGRLHSSKEIADRARVTDE